MIVLRSWRESNEYRNLHIYGWYLNSLTLYVCYWYIGVQSGSVSNEVLSFLNTILEENHVPIFLRIPQKHNAMHTMV